MFGRLVAGVVVAVVLAAGGLIARPIFEGTSADQCGIEGHFTYGPDKFLDALVFALESGNPCEVTQLSPGNDHRKPRWAEVEAWRSGRFERLKAAWTGNRRFHVTTPDDTIVATGRVRLYEPHEDLLHGRHAHLTELTLLP